MLYLKLHLRSILHLQLLFQFLYKLGLLGMVDIVHRVFECFDLIDDSFEALEHLLQRYFGLKLDIFCLLFDVVTLSFDEFQSLLETYSYLFDLNEVHFDYFILQLLSVQFFFKPGVL